MQINLAGYNVDADEIAQIKQLVFDNIYGQIEAKELSETIKSQLSTSSFTPETISAAYARISRADKGVRELRREARSSVSRARRSNERIVYEYGHSSVAEHAVFNIDIIDVSRLAIEEVEAHRLASYTEASQRYIAMSGAYVIPDEVLGVKLKDEFDLVCKRLFEMYGKLIDKLADLYADLPDQAKNYKSREDSRYVLPLACKIQVGMTLNARVAEKMIKTLSQSNLCELRLFGAKLNDELKAIVPSLIRYTMPNKSMEIVEKKVLQRLKNQMPYHATDTSEVQLIDYPAQQERLALATLLFRIMNIPFQNAKAYIDSLTDNEKRKLMIDLHKHIDEHSPVRRELELAYFTFAITLSASAFAQLKRHRIATLVKQDYDPELGCTLPNSLVEANAKGIFDDAMNISSDFYHKLKKSLKDEQKLSAQYILTNAHRRRVLFQLNARELTHFARLRMDEHAQWDIRSIATQMVKLAQDACPNLTLLACGKDAFNQIKQNTLQKL